MAKKKKKNLLHDQDQGLVSSCLIVRKFVCTYTNILIQLRAKQTAPLVNKHYKNEVTLRQQN